MRIYIKRIFYETKMGKDKVFYVERGEIYPCFGKAFQKSQTIFIRKDLPSMVQKFILNHEIYHLRSWKALNKIKNYNWAYEEIKANCYGAIKTPIGFIVCVFMSLSPYRLSFYMKKFLLGNNLLKT